MRRRHTSSTSSLQQQQQHKDEKIRSSKGICQATKLSSILLLLGFALLQVFFENKNKIKNKQRKSHSCDPNNGFQSYREPLHHEGLPFLGEVFATHDSVYLGAINMGVCDPEWGEGALLFAGQRFQCIYSFPGSDDERLADADQSSLHVLSDPVGPTLYSSSRQHDSWNFWTEMIMMIRCPLPPMLQTKLPTLFDATSMSTDLTVTLRSMVDLEEGRTGMWKYPSAHKDGEYSATGDEYSNLPVCSREWPQQQLQQQYQNHGHDQMQQKSNNVLPDQSLSQSQSSQQLRHNKIATKPTDQTKQRRRTLSMVTEILMEYETGEPAARTTVQIPPEQIITWIEYHRMIGFEHFYIYDNHPTQHGPLEELLQPYLMSQKDNKIPSTPIVTYVWYPIKDCIRAIPKDRYEGHRMAISQALSTNGAIHRYKHHTKFMGHFDIDEFIQLPEDVKDIKTILNEKMPENVSALIHTQEWFHDCNTHPTTGTFAALLNDSKEYCVSQDSTNGKSIMRTDDILSFIVHYPWVKTNHQLFNKETDAMSYDGLTIAHVRNERGRDCLGSASFESEEDECWDMARERDIDPEEIVGGLPLEILRRQKLVFDKDNRRYQLLQDTVEERMTQIRQLKK